MLRLSHGPGSAAVGAGCALADVTQTVDRVPDLLAGGRADAGGAVEHARRGGRRDSGERGDLGESGVLALGATEVRNGFYGHRNLR